MGLATKPAVWMPWADRSWASVRRPRGSGSENDAASWWRSGYCDVHTDDIAASV